MTQQHAQAQVALGRCYLHGIGVDATDETAAFRLFSLAARKGNAEGHYYMGLALRDGLGVGAADAATAREAFRMAANAGHREAEMALRAIMQASEGQGAKSELQRQTQPARERTEPSISASRNTQTGAPQAT